MSGEASTGSSEITFTVKGPSELKLSITISPEKTVAELKEVIAGKTEVEKERQRLIYSGKVLKDEEQISVYKIQSGHTIHMVKGAAKPRGATDSPAAAASTSSQRLPQMGTGLNVGSNPIDSIENVQHGLAGFNPFAGMQGMDNLNDPNAMASMMQNPEFLRSMSDMMSRPEVVDQIISANPQLASMAPQIRAMMSNPMVRQMMSNPETLRSMMQMRAAMEGSGGAGGMGGLGGYGGFNPFGMPGAAGGQGTADPFASLFAPQAGQAGNTTGGQRDGAAAAGQTTGAQPGQAGQTTGAGQTGAQGANPPPNPFASLWGLPGAGAPGAGAGAGLDFNNPLFAALRGGGSPWGAPASPADTRPPEEIYATQLGQLNAMGLWDAQKNIRALRSTGGNVEAAIELIFSGQVDQ